METVDQKIDRFRRYNRTMIAAALAKKNRRHQGLPAKLLMCSIFDSLSIAASPSNESHVGDRYKETISTHSNWVHHDRVSLLQLCDILDRIPQVPPAFSRLNNWAQSEKSIRFPASKRLVSRHKDLTEDPVIQEVIERWPLKSNGKPEKLGSKFFPYMFTHKHLLWMYRNKLTHEFRLPGGGIESVLKMKFDPYYQEVSTVSDIDPVHGFVFSNRWELIYPTGFIYRITKNTLESVCVKYQACGISPFSSYKEGSSWL